MIVLLDAGPLGMISNPSDTPENVRSRNWLERLVYHGAKVAVPEICDYEVRRELIRAAKTEGLRRLDGLKMMLEYAPISTAVMLRAAAYWAKARQMGRPSASDES